LVVKCKIDGGVVKCRIDKVDSKVLKSRIDGVSSKM